MKAVFVGAGPGCRAVLELYEEGRLSFFLPEILAVVDVDVDAPGLRFARERGWRTFTSIEDALSLPGVDLVVELTGSDSVVKEIHRFLPTGARVMDHVLARVFWDLDEVFRKLQQELAKKTVLEAQIKDDRTRLQEIIDSLPQVVMVLDQDMKILRVNRRFEQVTKTGRHVARGQYCYDVFCRTNQRINCMDEVSCPFLMAEKTRSPHTMVHYADRDNGERAYFEVTATPLFDEAGKMTRVVESSREITEQVLLRQETEQSALRFRQIVNAVHGIITIKGLNGRFQLVNPRAAQFFGLEPDQLVGRRAAEVFPQDVASLMEENDQQAMDLGHHVSIEVIQINGQEKVVVAERFPMTGFRGNKIGICCVARDDTRQRELQRELLQSERLAAVGKLAAGVAHELNNPLTGILTFAEDLMLETTPDDPAHEDYEIIVNEAMRCRRIVRDLLDFSRQQAPRLLPKNINPVVDRTVKMVERQASFHDIQFVLDLEDDLPKVKIDGNLIQQAILNLVINARDAMDLRGQITISTSAAEDSVVVSVSDTGKGISDNQIQKIFEPFFTTKGDHGNGLGLPAVVSILQQHDGEVEVQSQLDVGTTFQLLLPPATGRKP
ncbi:MAG: PAS domain-containing protein [Proteobacteria bacterium]|nr:PAS domain-containing protein [Pseudomonadota bacterium]